MELKGYNRPPCNRLCASRRDALDRRRCNTQADRRLIFTARCYASAVLAMGLCPSVSSVTSRYSIETAERIELILACELPSTLPTLC